MTTLFVAASITTLIVTLCYVGLCAIQPFAPCRRCDRTGHRIRTGRRVWTYLRHTHTRGTR